MTSATAQHSTAQHSTYQRSHHRFFGRSTHPLEVHHITHAQRFELQHNRTQIGAQHFGYDLWPQLGPHRLRVEAVARAGLLAAGATAALPRLGACDRHYH